MGTFPHRHDLRVAVETAKRMLTKEKIYKQLAGHTPSTPFMSVRDGQIKRVTFDTADDLETKDGQTDK